jgi:hypothetical protein
MSKVTIIPEGQGTFKRKPGPPKMSAEMRVLFDAWCIARTLETFPPEQLSWGFDKYCRYWGIEGPNRERSVSYREVSFSDFFTGEKD